MAKGMKIGERVSRIIAGSANRIVDVLENSTDGVVLEQAIREVVDARDDIRHDLGKVIASIHLTKTKITQLNDDILNLDEQSKIAIEGKRDDLAEAAINRQLDLENQTSILNKTLNANEADKEEFEGYIIALNTKLVEMKDDLQAFKRLKKETCDISDDVISEAENTFNRVMDNSLLSASGSVVSGEEATKLQELSDLTRSSAVSNRLAKMKEGMKSND